VATTGERAVETLRISAAIGKFGEPQEVGLTLVATPEGNGNPRILYVVLFPNRHALAFDAGHRGVNVVPATLRNKMKGFVRFATTVAEYERCRKWGANVPHATE